MKFRNQTRYAGRTISNVLNKPLMRKKGKQWVVVSLSALMLLGLGGIAASTTHASVVPNSRAQTMAVKSGMNSALAKSAQPSAQSSATNSASVSSAGSSVKPSAVEQQAKQMKAGLMKTAMVHQPTATGRTNSASVAPKSASAKSASDNDMQALNLGNGLQQAKRWNFVQHGINNTDFIPTNVSGSNRVNSKASGNRIVSANSASAKSNVAPSAVNNNVKAPVNAHKPFNSAYNSYETQMSGADAQVADANAVNAENNSDSNKNSRAILKDNARPQPANKSNNKSNKQVTDTLQYEDNAGNEVNSDTVQGNAGSDIPNSDVQDNVPSDYQLNQQLPVKFTNSDGNVIVNVKAGTQNGNIDVKPNEVTVTGTIELQFNNGSASNGNITTVPLQYGFQTSDDNSANPANGNNSDAVNALNHTDFFDNVMNPAQYSSNHDVFRLDNGQPIQASDFTYTGATGENAPYMINVSKGDGQYVNGSQHHIFKNIILNFKANNTQSDTETINYVDPNGSDVGARTVQASDGTQLPTANSTKQGTIGGNVPKGYTVNSDNPADVIMHKGGNQIIHVTPTNDTPADITGATQPQPNGQTKVISGTDGENGQNGKDDKNVDGTTPSQLNKGGVVPKGYHVDPNNPVAPDKNPDGTQKTNKDGKPEYTVNVQPNNEHMVIRYYYENNGKQIFVGDDHFAGAYNTSDTVTADNDKGLDSGYQLTGQNDTFKFGSDRDDNNIIQVPVTIKTTSETVDVHDANDDPVNKEGQPIINGKAKNGDNTTKTIIIKGQDGHMMTPSDLTKSGQLPKGYHATSSVTPGVKGKNGQTPSVQVAPNSEHEFVRYYYTDAKGNKVQVGNTIMQGQYGQSDTVMASNDEGLDSGYQLTGKSDTFTYGSDRDDNNITQVPVKPQAFTNKDTVTFKDINGKTIGNGTVPADSTPSDAGKNIEGKGSNQNDKNQVPNGYHIINSDQTINPDNGNHTVLVAPNAGTPAKMSYKQPGSNTTKVITLNGVNGQKVTPSDLNNSGLLPKGYHATNGAIYGNNGKDGNTPQVINIAPDEESEIVRYYYYGKNGQKVFVGDDYFDGQSGTKADVTSHDNAQPDAAKLSDNGLNSGYILNNANNDFTFKANSDASAADANNENVMMVPVHLANTNTSDTIQYINVDGNVVNTTNNKSDFVVGKGAPSDVIPDNTIKSELPSDYQVVDPNQVVHFNGAKHTVLVAPVQTTEYVNFYPNDDASQSPKQVAIKGDKNSKVNLNNYVPTGYHLETHTQNGQNVDPNITLSGNTPQSALKYGADPNNSADTIIYVDDDNNTNNGNVVGSYQTGGGAQNQPLAGNDVPTLTEKDSHDNVPAGYKVDTDKQGNSTNLTYDGLSHVIYVKGIVPSNAQQNNVTVNIYKKGANGNSLVKTMKVNEPGIIGSSYTINPTDPDILSNVPTGAAPEASDVPATGQITTNGLTVKNVNFTYDVPTGASNTIMVYYRTKDGRTLNFGAINDSHKGDTGDVTQKVSVPQGFEVVPNQKQSTKYVVTSEPQYISVLIQGEPAKNIFSGQNSDKTKITVNYVYRNYGGSFTKSRTTQFHYQTDHIGDSMQIDPSSGLVGTIIPGGYHLDPADQIVTSYLTANGATPNEVTFVYDAQNKPVNIHFAGTNNDGHPMQINDATPQQVNGNTNSDITNSVKVPEGYHLVPGERVKVPSNNTATEDVTVQLQGDKVVGHAKLNLLYERGNHVSDEVKILPISGSIGDSDIVINPQDFDKRGYKVSTASDWSIPFTIGNVVATDHGDTFRYSPEQTFIYKASPVTIDVSYVDTQTGKTVDAGSVNGSQNGQITAYDGDTLDLEDANASNNTGANDDNQKNDSNAVISVDGHDYRLNLPQGYHLAHVNNYILVAQNATKPVSVINPLTGRHMLRMMPLMKLTLGIMPHFHKHNTQPANKPAKPASKGSVTPAKPASASSVAPSSASSASQASASASSSVPDNNTNVAPINTYVPDTPAGNTYIYNTSNSSNITNNYNYSSNNSESVSSATSENTTDVQPARSYSKPVRRHGRIRRGIKRIVKNYFTKNIHKNYNYKNIRTFNALQHIKAGATVRYHGMTIKRISQKRQNLFYFYVIRGCSVHSKMNNAKKTFVHYLSPRHGWTIPIQRIFRFNGRIWYEIRWNHRIGFVTGNRRYTRNSYYQHRDMRRNRHSYHYIKTVRYCYEYRTRFMKNWSRVRIYRPGTVLKIRRLVTISHLQMTRFQLPNGHWVTSNRNFVKLFK